MERVRREHERERDHRAEPAAPAALPAEQILRLQQGAGNAAVARMLAREPSDAPALDAPAASFSAGDLSGLLAHLQDQIAEAQQESAANQVAESQADRAAGAEGVTEPKQRSGVLATLAKPVRRLGSALKKAGAWLGIGGKRKPEAAAAPVTGAAGAVTAAGVASGASATEADGKELAATIAKLEQEMEARQAELGAVLGSMSEAGDVAMEAIDPSEREAIVRRTGA